MRYVCLSLVVAQALSSSAIAAEVSVVTTLPDYATFAKAIGGDRVRVEAIVQGNQDAHFIRPKPSFVGLVAGADLLVDTGLDLELWLPTVVDKSGNARVRSGQIGYVSAAQGMNLLEKPTVMSRAEGGVHIHGNPHVTSSPINMRTAARNIAVGLAKVDPEGAAGHRAGAERLVAEIDRRLFGEELVKLLGGDSLCRMAENGTLVPFLEDRTFRGSPLVGRLGGWMKRMMPLRGTAIVTYHKNWVYFAKLFGLEEAGTVEPKPGIPPSPKHVTELVTLMRARKIRIVLAANYFDEQQVRSVAESVGAVAAIVPLYVGGEYGVDDYFALVDRWTDALLKAAREAGVIPPEGAPGVGTEASDV
jgi:zinc/manganese transport system substrate-binding protein